MPSMVRISWPSASAASIRQEQTRRPSSVIEQAPQSPDAQPSFEPVRPSAPRSASSMVSYGSQRNSTGSPLTVVETCTFAMSSLPSRTLGSDRNRALAENAGSLDTIGNGAALVVDRTAGGAAGFSGFFQRRVVELRADQGLACGFNQQCRRRHRAEADTGSRADAILQGEIGAEADDGDIHLGARDHA